MMNNERENYKGQFISNLRPFLDMLENQHKEIESRFWITMITSLSTSISRNPEQYLGNDRPNQELTNAIIQEIFDDFMKSHEQELEPLLEEKA